MIKCLLLLVLLHGTCGDRVGNFYKIETNFTRFENPSGKQRGGIFCDNLSACDPQIYAFVDLKSPRAAFPGSSTDPYRDFVFVHGELNMNMIKFHPPEPQMVKILCELGVHPLPREVNTRVEIRDLDDFTPNDIIEQFDCIFPFEVIRNQNNANKWSNEITCKPVKHDYIKLYIRYRIRPIFSTQCFVPSHH